MPAAKSRSVRRFQARFLNPIVARLMDEGLMPASYALIETTGRRSGLARQNPVGNGLVGDHFWIVAEPCGGRISRPDQPVGPPSSSSRRFSAVGGSVS